ncbi:MAG: hypothetical protein ABSA30_00165 [Candidatus Aminicenantales bacterium]|jgi:hypothetical protein
MIDWTNPKLSDVREQIEAAKRTGRSVCVSPRWLDEILTAVEKKLHRRRCFLCGHVGYYADSIRPYCLCEQCGSQDTRRVKEPQTEWKSSRLESL